MTFDSLLQADLAALGADSRRDPIPLAESVPSGVYRDDRPGAEARRDALLDQRRHELAFMPLAYAHVFAHRVGRAAAGGAAVVCAFVTLLLIADPFLYAVARWFVPGLNLTTLLALSAGKILAAYILASWIAERVFAARMQRALATVGDAHADLDRLATGPIDVARSLVRRADGWSVGLMLAGVVSSMALVAFSMFTIGVASLYPRSWQVANGTNAELLFIALALGVAAASWVGLVCDREHRRPSKLLAKLGHWGAPALGVFLGATALFGGLKALLRTTRFAIEPSEQHRFMIAAAAIGAVFLIAAFLILWWRRREAARLT